MTLKKYKTNRQWEDQTHTWRESGDVSALDPAIVYDIADLEKIGTIEAVPDEKLAAPPLTTPPPRLVTPQGQAVKPAAPVPPEHAAEG